MSDISKSVVLYHDLKKEVKILHKTLEEKTNNLKSLDELITTWVDDFGEESVTPVGNNLALVVTVDAQVVTGLPGDRSKLVWQVMPCTWLSNKRPKPVKPFKSKASQTKYKPSKP